MDPGCLILWDSRTIHGGYVGKGPLPEEDRLYRLSMTVCMTPFTKWDREKYPNLLQNRLKAVIHGNTTNHWPYEFASNQMPDNGKGKDAKKYEMPNFDDTRLGLLRGPKSVIGWSDDSGNEYE